MSYQLLAADMDGTLLNSQKTISPANISAINQALDAGKQVVFSTGRSICELSHFFALFPKMRYCICESGALVYDILEQKAIAHFPIPSDIAHTILDYANTQDIMIQILAKNLSIINAEDQYHLAHFCMGQYQDCFDYRGIFAENCVDYFYKMNCDCDKICLYHTSPEQREQTIQKFASIPLATALAEETSLEISCAGVDKGVGLGLLCAHLGIDISQTIAVGDSFNDMAILKKAGLSVAVANARREILAICDEVVADCDHDGVAQAIHRLLLPFSVVSG